MSATIGRVVTGVEGKRVRLRSQVRAILDIICSRSIASPANTRQDWLAPPPLWAFKNIEPINYHKDNDDDDWFVFDPEDVSPDVIWPINCGFIYFHEDGENGPFSLSRLVSVTPKEVRGFVPRVTPRMLRFDMGEVYGNTIYTGSGVMIWYGGRWVDSAGVGERKNNGALSHPTFVQQDDGPRKTARFATSLALRHRYEWAVSIGRKTTPSIRFATDPTGIKDLFKFRDIPEGRDRRDALHAWVSDHWRQTRHDPEVETYVRRHLRGTTRFSWEDFECEIVPAAFDLEKRDSLIAEREAMRLCRMDKRAKP